MANLKSLVSSKSDNNTATEVTEQPDNVTADNLADMIEKIRDLVESKDVDLEAYRAAFKEEHGEDTTLDDDGIITAIASTDDDDMEATVALMLEMQTASGDEPEVSAATEEVKAAGSVLAEKLAKDDRFSASVDAILTAKEVLAVGPVQILVHLERIWSADDWALVPVPGSKKGTTGSLPYDIVESKDGKRKINISWFKEAAKTIKPSVYADLTDAMEVLKPLEKRELTNDQRKEWNRLPFLKKRAMYNKYAARVNAFEGVLTRAVRVRFMRDKIMAIKFTDDNGNARSCIGIDYSWADKKAGVLFSGANPIEIWDGRATSLNDQVSDTYSVVTFLKINPDALAKLQTDTYDPTYNDLVEQLSRDREAKAAQKLANRFKLANVKEAIFAYTSVADWCDNDGNDKLFKKHMAGLSNKRDENNPKIMTEREQEIWMFCNAQINMLALYNYYKGEFNTLDEKVKSGELIDPAEMVDAIANAKAEAEKQRKAG